MKKIALLLIVFFLAVSPTFAKRLGTLPKLLKPTNLDVSGDTVYVIQGAVVSLYSIKDLKLIRQFGKAGEGPGEQKITPFYNNKISVFDDSVMVEGLDKIIFFRKNGELIREIKKKSMLIIRAEPIGKKFVVNQLRMKNNKETNKMCVTLYDSKLDEVKDIYCMTHFQQGSRGATKWSALMDKPEFRVYKDKIFVEDGSKGFLILVYDNTGKLLYKIEKPFEKIKITNEYKQKVIDKYKNDAMIKRGGGWDHFKKTATLKFPEILPAIKNFEIDDDKIFVQTYKEKDGKIEYVILTLKGDVIKKVYLPRFESNSVLDGVLGIKHHCLSNNTLYYLQENEDEDWELFAEKIN